MREILITVTFRDFTGGSTDEIQRMVIKSIATQTYQNYKLIVTVSKEKKVEQVLKEYGVKYICHKSNDYRWTTVFSNAFQYLEKGKNIILTTSADNVFDPNFFQEIISHFEPGIGGTSYPPFHYFSLDKYEEGVANNYRDFKSSSQWVDYHDRKEIQYFFQIDPNVIIPECIFLDGDLMLEKKNKQLYLDHKLVGVACPGCALSIMAGFYAKRLINLIYKTKVHTIETPQKLKTVSHDFTTWKKNDDIVHSFFKKRDFDDKFWIGTPLQTEKFFVHSQYKPIGNWYQRLIYFLYMRINTFPFKIRGLWFPQNISVILLPYVLRNVILFFSHRKLLPLFIVRIIIRKNKNWIKYFRNYNLKGLF